MQLKFNISVSYKEGQVTNSYIILHFHLTVSIVISILWGEDNGPIFTSICLQIVSVHFQSRKRLQKYKCPFVRPSVRQSVNKTPKQLKINDFNTHTITYFITYNITHYITQNIAHTINSTISF